MSEEQRVLRRVRDADTREVLRAAFRAGCRWSRRKSGVVVYGAVAGESAVCHFTPSDHRAAANFRAQLKKIGVLCVA